MAITVTGEAGPVMELVRANLSLYDVDWRLSPRRSVKLSVGTPSSPPADEARGTYLVANQMRVDRTEAGWRATTDSGATLVGIADGDGEAWQLGFPPAMVEAQRWSEIEDLLTVVLTVGWRRAGWVPLHAAGLRAPGLGVLACASSMGGKTTFTLAMARRGWQALGDDKLLLGESDGRLVIGAVKHTLNVDPAVANWFPELGGLAGLPPYSAWTAKRRMPLATHWPAARAYEMSPTHVLVLERSPSGGEAVRVEPLTRSDTIAALLRQSVIPRDRDAARWSAGVLARLAERVAGVRVEVPDGVFAYHGALDPLEPTFR